MMKYKNNYYHEPNYNKHEIKLHIIIPFIIIIAVIVISFNIYAHSSKNNFNDFVGDIPESEEIEINMHEEKPYEIIEYTASNGQTYNIVGTINIPKLNIEYPIMAEYTEALLKIAPTKYWGSDPNRVGNMVVLGHNYKNTKFFSKLSKLEIGDVIQITDTSGKTLDYSVYNTFVIEPDDNSCTSQLTNGNIEITLITCYYSKDNVKRFVVKARAN